MVAKFVRKHADTRLKFDLLFFWSQYPNAKFTLKAITHALNCRRRIDVEDALEALIEAELLEKHLHRELPFYCVAADPEKRQPFLQLSKYSRHQLRRWYEGEIEDPSLSETGSAPMNDQAWQISQGM